MLHVLRSIIDFFFFCYSIFFNRKHERQSKYIFAHSFIQSLSCSHRMSHTRPLSTAKLFRLFLRKLSSSFRSMMGHSWALPGRLPIQYRNRLIRSRTSSLPSVLLKGRGLELEMRFSFTLQIHRERNSITLTDAVEARQAFSVMCVCVRLTWNATCVFDTVCSQL